METGPRLIASSDKLVKPGIEPTTPGLQGKRFIHYTTAAPLIETKLLHCHRVFKKRGEERGGGVRVSEPPEPHWIHH